MSNNKPKTKKSQVDLLKKLTDKKLRSEKVIDYMVFYASVKTVERMEVCGEFLTMLADGKKEKKKLLSGNFCGHRFCPMCAWRQAKKDALKIDIMMRYIEDMHKKAFILLTFTAPNVPGEKLRGEITKFNKAFKRLTERKEVIPVNKGYIRKLEVTYNQERDDYHPHFHVIMAVNKSYFTDRTYIKERRWLEIWQECMDDFSITQVDARAIKRDTKGNAQAEVAKYAAKDSDMTINETVFDTLFKALKGRQVLTYNGLFSDAHKLYKAKKLETYKDIDENSYEYIILNQWGKKEYEAAECRLLSMEERRKFNQELLDEIEIEID